MTADQAKAELHELMHGRTAMLYAFAFGAGCTLAAADYEPYRAIRERDADLRAIIAEQTDS